jgi:hypothetical protein
MATVLRIAFLAAALALLIGTPPAALADDVVTDDQIVVGRLCVGLTCVNNETFVSPGGELKIKGTAPHLLLEDSDDVYRWIVLGDPTGLGMSDVNAGTTPFAIAAGAPSAAFVIDDQGKVGLGTFTPSQPLHVQKDQNANTFILVRNAADALNANAVVRTQADTAVQNFQSHASSRTLVRWGVPLGGWNEFLSVAGAGLAMGTLGNAPFTLGTSATARMTFDGDSNVISFGGGGQYDGSSFVDASSRALKQDIHPLGAEAAGDALAGLEPVTFSYTAAPGDPRVGFIAEDVPELVATPGRQTLSALEIVAVLTRIVKEQQRTAQEQQKAIAELTARLAALEARP